MQLNDRINVGIAIAADGALVVPTLADADVKSLARIARESRRLAERVKSHAIAPPELSGAPLAVSNVGISGVSAIAPGVDPRRAAILGVGKLGERVDGGVLTLTLTCDHRVLDAAEAAGFLAHVRDTLQQPMTLAL